MNLSQKDFDECGLKVFKEQLGDLLEKVKKLDDEILDLLSADDNQEMCLTEARNTCKFQRNMKEVLMKVEKRVDTFKLPPSQERRDTVESGSLTVTINTQRVRVQLPKLRMKKFS